MTPARKRLVSGLFLSIPFLAALALLALALLLEAPLLCAIAFFGAAAGTPFFSLPRTRVLSLLIALGLAIGFPEQVIREVDARQDELTAVIAKGGPTALTTFDRLTIWGLGLAMVPGGLLAGYPEVAREQLYLYVPNPPVRDFTSDFAMRSERIRSPLQHFAQRVKTGVRAKLAPERIAFRYGRDDLRVTLALNPAQLSATWDGTKLDATAEVDVRYVPRSKITLGKLKGVPLYAEEGLFHALQELNWLHPYVARWHWTVGPRSN